MLVLNVHIGAAKYIYYNFHAHTNLLPALWLSGRVQQRMQRWVALATVDLGHY